MKMTFAAAILGMRVRMTVLGLAATGAVLCAVASPALASERPATGQPAAGSSGSGELGPEIASMRTRNSRTYQTADGRGRVARFSATPINFKDASGDWQPIDNSLTRNGANLTNGDNRYDLDLPSRLTAGDPVTVSEGGDQVSFALQGADATATAKANEATFADAIDGRRCRLFGPAGLRQGDSHACRAPTLRRRSASAVGGQGLAGRAQNRRGRCRVRRLRRSSAVHPAGAVHVRGGRSRPAEDAVTTRWRATATVGRSAWRPTAIGWRLRAGSGRWRSTRRSPWTAPAGIVWSEEQADDELLRGTTSSPAVPARTITTRCSSGRRRQPPEGRARAERADAPVRELRLGHRSKQSASTG